MTFLLMNGSRWIYSISVNAVFSWTGKSYLKQLSQFLLNKEDDLGGTYERHNFSRWVGYPTLSAMCQVSRQSDITDFEEVVKPD